MKSITLLLVLLTLQTGGDVDLDARIESLASPEREQLVLQLLPEYAGNRESFDRLVAKLSFNTITAQDCGLLATALIKIDAALQVDTSAHRPPKAGSMSDSSAFWAINAKLRELVIGSNPQFDKDTSDKVYYSTVNYLEELVSWGTANRANPVALASITKAIDAAKISATQGGGTYDRAQSSRKTPEPELAVQRGPEWQASVWLWAGGGVVAILFVLALLLRGRRGEKGP
jgi:hypothetical protein